MSDSCYKGRLIFTRRETKKCEILSAVVAELLIFALDTKERSIMKIKVINKSKHPLPAYATELSAGMDLRANLDQPIVMKPLERCLVPTGLYMALPAGYEAQVRPPLMPTIAESCAWC
jgi:hypothetical protein